MRLLVINILLTLLLHSVDCYGKLQVTDFGEQMGDETKGLVDKTEWYSIENYEGESSDLVKRKIDVSQKEIALCTGEPYVMVTHKGESVPSSLFLVRGEKFKEGKIPSKYFSKLSLVVYPRRKVEVSIGDQKVSFYGSVKKLSESYQPGVSLLNIDSGYAVLMKHSSHQVVLSIRKNPSQGYEIVWVGDINNDGIPDVLMRGSGEAPAQDKHFFMSKKTKKGFQMIYVGATGVNLPC